MCQIRYNLPDANLGNYLFYLKLPTSDRMTISKCQKFREVKKDINKQVSIRILLKKGNGREPHGSPSYIMKMQINLIYFSYQKIF